MFADIPGSKEWKHIEPLTKGWSKDKKFHVVDKSGREMLLRISDSDLYDKKKRQFELLKKVENLCISASAPIYFGVLKDGRVYTLLTWLRGEDAEVVLPTKTPQEAYTLGLQAGQAMYRLHQIDIPKEDWSWERRYINKIEKKIENFKICPVDLPKKQLIIDYVTENLHLVHNRPTRFEHGDFHCGNMIVSDTGIGIIDFDKNKTADPYDEFKPFCWNVYANPQFENGIIHGYFAGDVPEDFFPVLSLYAAEYLLSHITWAMHFGDAEVKTAKKLYDDILRWFSDFQSTVPSWYQNNCK